jgi:hypothetical protein
MLVLLRLVSISMMMKEAVIDPQFFLFLGLPRSGEQGGHYILCAVTGTVLG